MQVATIVIPTVVRTRKAFNQLERGELGVIPAGEVFAGEVIMGLWDHRTVSLGPRWRGSTWDKDCDLVVDTLLCGEQVSLIVKAEE